MIITNKQFEILPPHLTQYFKPVEDLIGWKTQLKPAHEPIVMARKPMNQSTIDNVLEHGTGALNIDATRISFEGDDDIDEYIDNVKGPAERSKANNGDATGMFEGKTGYKHQKRKIIHPGKKNEKTQLKPAHEPIVMARKPMGQSTVDNVLEHGTGALNIDACRIEWSDDRAGKTFNKGYSQGTAGIGGANTTKQDDHIDHIWPAGRYPSNVLGEIEGYQKYFYCPKVSREERHIGYEAPKAEPLNNAGDMKDHTLWDPSIGNNTHRLMTKIREHNAKGNNHPTVKPVELMAWLVKLVTPPNGKVLDPFMGSGSTGMAATELGFEFTGMELDEAYCEIAKKRIEKWSGGFKHSNVDQDVYNGLFKDV